MNKIAALSILCFLSIGLNASASTIFPYQSSPAKPIGGVVKTEAGQDTIILPSAEKCNLLKEARNAAIFTIFETEYEVIKKEPSILLTLDPYIIPIDGNNYVMVKDKQDNNWSEKDLLGYEDPKDQMFNSLRGLDVDSDNTKITANELKKASIRLVKLAEDGTLLVKDRTQDLNLNKIKYIDIKNLRRTANSQNTGIFGHFYVYLNTEDGSRKMTVGYITFDTNSNLKIMFQ